VNLWVVSYLKYVVCFCLWLRKLEKIALKCGLDSRSALANRSQPQGRRLSNDQVRVSAIPNNAGTTYLSWNSYFEISDMSEEIETLFDMLHLVTLVGYLL
jgi:hypothetical protein